MSANFWSAICLTTLSGLSTCIGGLFVICNGTPTFRKLGHTMSFSAGVMMFISFMDLLPDSVEVLGYLYSNYCFFAGIIFFAGITTLIPEPDMTAVTSKKNKKKENLSNVQRKQLLSVGIVTAVGISLHNFPEGIAVYLACLRGAKMGLPLAFAIAAHNIPEGIAVAAPIYHSTGSKWEAFKWSFISGVCEPIGAVVVGVLFHNFFSEELVCAMMAFVAGIMVLICIQELIPASLKYISAKEATFSQVAGMVTVMLGVQLIETYL